MSELPGLVRRDLYPVETVVAEIEAPATRIAFGVECLHSVGGRPCHAMWYLTEVAARADDHGAWNAHPVRIIRRELDPMPTDQTDANLAALGERRRNGTAKPWER